jgi:hypothetical protein
MSQSLPCIFSIDVGSNMSGVCVISNSNIIECVNLSNDLICAKIKEYYVKYRVVPIIEDIRAYSGKLSQDVIDTCKFIGELTYRLINELQVPYFKLYTRSKVRKWVFDAFPDVCIAAIDKKIAYLDEYGKRKNEELRLAGKKPKYRRYITKSGELRKASFNYVDDRIIIAVMKKLWNIPEPKPFKGNIYGLKEDSWQALALASYYLYGLPGA